MQNAIGMIVLVGFSAFHGCVEIRRPAEHEEQQYMILGTPTYEVAVGIQSEPVQYELIANTIPDQDVLLVVNNMGECTSYRQALEADYGISTATFDAHVRCEKIPHDDLWFRDMGGVFVHGTISWPGHPEHGLTGLAVVDYEFNGWNYEQYIGLGYYETDDAVASELGDALGIPVISSSLTAEGGAITCNGAGTCIYTDGAMFSRNPGWTREQIEAELSRTLGADTLIGMPEWHPLDGHSVEDGPFSVDTDGDSVEECYHLPATVRHIDEFVAFLDEDTVLVSQMEQSHVRNDIDQQVKDMLDRAWDYLEAETDFELIAFPEGGFASYTLTPDDEMFYYLGYMDPLPGAGTSCEFDLNADNNITRAGTYMNYVVTNGAVFAPQLFEEGLDTKFQDLDAEVVTLLGQLYPGRTIVPLANKPGAIGGGGSHCWTQEVVAVQ